MAHHDERSVQQIKADTERTRAQLTNTVEQLRASVSETASDIRHRISPTAIKAEVSDYFKSRGEQLMDDMSYAARNNPMQALAIGAAIGYPLLKIGRAIPLPVLMIGAGLFLTSTRRGQALVDDTRDYASDLTDQAVHQAQAFGNQVSRSVSDIANRSAEAFDEARDAALGQAARIGDTLSGATSAAESWANHGAGKVEREASSAAAAAGGQIQDWRDSAARTANSVSDQASRSYRDATGAIRDTASSAAAAAGGQIQDWRDTASRTADRVSDQASRTYRDATGAIRDTAADAANTMNQAYDSAKAATMQAARSVRESTMYAAGRANRTIGNTVQQNPLLVVGLGLVVGAIIASSLPRTDLEDELVGPASDKLKARAQDAAAEQFEAAKGAATGALDHVVESARREGLSAEGLEASARDIAQRVRQVADAGVSTAFKGGTENNEGGGRNHG